MPNFVRVQGEISSIGSNLHLNAEKLVLSCGCNQFISSHIVGWAIDKSMKKYNCRKWPNGVSVFA